MKILNTVDHHSEYIYLLFQKLFGYKRNAFVKRYINALIENCEHFI